MLGPGVPPAWGPWGVPQRRTPAAPAPSDSPWWWTLLRQLINVLALGLVLAAVVLMVLGDADVAAIVAGTDFAAWMLWTWLRFHH
ncbi:hypothetical protein [Nocardia gipuzkoensis]